MDEKIRAQKTKWRFRGVKEDTWIRVMGKQQKIIKKVIKKIIDNQEMKEQSEKTVIITRIIKCIQ